MMVSVCHCVFDEVARNPMEQERRCEEKRHEECVAVFACVPEVAALQSSRSTGPPQRPHQNSLVEGNV